MKLFSCAAFPILLRILSSATSTGALLNAHDLAWSLRPTNSTQQFRGLSTVSNEVVWIAGMGDTVLRTIDGVTWSDVSPLLAPENATAFQYRDIQAWSENVAVVLSIGEENASRIYRTQNGGKNWTRTFVNDEPTAFYDCLAFENTRYGLALSDPVDGKFRLIETWDGGATWAIVDSRGIPPALSGEFGFAASGTCLEAAAGRWYIASGGVDPAGRIFRSDDGYRWRVGNSSIIGGASAGVFSVRFRDAKHGLAVGGDFEKPTVNVDIAAWSRDGGRSWHKPERFPGGYRSGLSWVPGRGRTAIAVGTSGTDITFDGGRNWRPVDNGIFDTVNCVSRNVCWASDSQGRVARLDLAGL